MTRNISFFRLAVLFVYIAVPVYVLAWGAGLFSYPDYQKFFLLAKGSSDAEIPVKVYFRTDGGAEDYDSAHSLDSRIFLHADDFTGANGIIRAGGKAVSGVRAEFVRLRESDIDTVEIKRFTVSGKNFPVSDKGAVALHDLELSETRKDSAVLKVTGPAPYIETLHPVNFPGKVIVSGICAGLLSAVLFLIVVRIPVLRRLAGLGGSRK